MQARRLPLDLRRALCCALVASVLALSPALARADSVLLITPKRADPVLQDVFHRLEAELKIHGYETQSAAGGEAEAKPAASARAAGALAAIALAKRGSAVTLQVWLIDRAGTVSGPRRIDAGGARDASSLLAVRAVDLLRATFGEPVAPVAPASSPSVAADGGGAIPPSASPPTPATPPNPPAPQSQAAAPPPAPAPPAAPPKQPAPSSAPPPAPPAPAPTRPQPSAAAPPEQEPFVPEPPNQPDRARPLLWLSAEGALIYPGAKFGTAFGPTLGIDAWLLPWLSLGAHGAAPLLGTELTTGSGTAKLTEELAWLELRVRVLSIGPLEVCPLLGAGVDWLQGKGHPNQPLTSAAGHNWSWMAQLGVRADVALSPRLHVGAALRLIAFAPPLEVAIATRDSARLSLPTLSATLGLALGLF